MKRLLIFVAGAIAIAAMAGAAAAQEKENMLYLELKDGRVVIELLPDLAPAHVDRIKELARKNFYDGIVFHRVIEGFMAQTDDPTGTGRGGSGKNLDAEFSTEQHVLRKGESLWYLAERKYRIPIWLLRQYNPELDLASLPAGAHMVVPVVEPRAG